MRSVALESKDIQYGALPWRRVHGELQILLVTTLNTRRWIVPKGWPIPGLAPCDCAAHEAAEEAGVSGDVQTKPLGSFQYDKRQKSGDTLQCKVDVFALEVLHRRRNWPEKAARETSWCSVEEALARVSEPGLRRLIARFAKLADAQMHAGEVVAPR